MNLETLFQTALDRSATDLHLVDGERPRLRIDGALVPLDADADLAPLLTPEASARLAVGLPVERVLDHRDRAFVGTIFRAHGRINATFRILDPGIPPLEGIAGESLPLFRRIVDNPQGFVLVVGATGSGKWTTAAALVDAINAERDARILVVESHPGLRFGSRKGLVTALHVGVDLDGYARALDVVAGADVDVLLLDDLPTLDVLRGALKLAAGGRLVVANLNVPTAAEAVERLLESSGDEAPALRRALAENLVAVVGQRLVPGVGGKGRVPVYEWLDDERFGRLIR